MCTGFEEFIPAILESFGSAGAADAAATAGIGELGGIAGATAGTTAGMTAAEAAASAATAGGLASEAAPAAWNAAADSQLASSQLGITGAESAANAMTPSLSSVATPAMTSSIGPMDIVKGLNTANSAVNFAKNPNLQTGIGAALGATNIPAVADAFGGGSSVPTGGGDGLGGSVTGADAFSPPADSPPSMTGTPSGGTPSGEMTAGSNAAGAGTGIGAGGTPAADVGSTLQGNSSIQKALQALGINSGKDALQYANAGLGATGLAMQAKMGSSAQNQMNKIAGPTSAVGNQLLQQFQAGQISPTDAFTISQNAQHQKAQVDQYYAKAGLSNSSMHTQALAQIDKEAENQRQQAVQNMLKSGLAASGVANPTLVAGVNAGLQQDNAAMKSMQDFLKTLSGMGAQQAAAPAASPTPSGVPG
jgi:hypothetical protein